MLARSDRTERRLRRYVIPSVLQLVLVALVSTSCTDVDSVAPNGLNGEPPVAVVIVTASTTTVALNETTHLTATLTDSEGETLGGRAITWSSSNETIATVDMAGLVTGVAEGAAAIIASSEGKQGSLTITVMPVPVASIEVVPTSAAILVGGTVQLTAATRDVDGNVLTGRPITWSSSSQTVAVVDATGLVTGLAEGSTTITATSEGISGSSAVTVSGQPAAVPVPTLMTAVLRSPEPACLRASTIVCEDFETEDRSNWSDYEPNNFSVASDDAFGGTRSMRQLYNLGQVDAGWLAWFFGDHPLGGVRSGERFEEVHLRWYHKFQTGWPASYPPKMARMRSHYISCQWCFAWAEHFWLLSDGTAVSDPFSHIAAPGGTEYTATARWPGETPMALNFDGRDGEWVALEMRIALNGPGQDDGRITYWANGDVVLDRTGLNLRGAYTATTINVAMIDTYWNGGSPAAGLKRWYDNVVVATEPIGCASFTVAKSPLADQAAWHLQVALDTQARPLVWDSGIITGAGTEVAVGEETGTFQPGAPTCVLPSGSYIVRARQERGGEWSPWSDWAPMF